jgi:hypothetical protein
MDIKHIKTIEGSERPADIFQPHMPGVELLSDMDAFFSKVRIDLAAGGLMPDEKPGQRYFAIVTPGRNVMFPPLENPPRQGNTDIATKMEKTFPAYPPLNFSVVTYTFIEAIMQDMTRCVPFLGFLAVFAFIGHSVVVFEGHPSAFESGVRDSDVLLVDSGMTPFMQSDWIDVAHRVMRPNGRIFVHDRETYTLGQIILRQDEQEERNQQKRWWKFW